MLKKTINGTYSNGYDKLIFKYLDSFEYYSRVEGGITEYTTGKYIIDKNKIFLNSYSNKYLIPFSYLKKDTSRMESEIIINSYTNAEIIKFSFLINGQEFRVFKNIDTFKIQESIRSLQIKSFISGGVFAAPLVNDTLFSELIDFKERINSLIINTTVNSKDFFRVYFKENAKFKNVKKIKFRNCLFTKLN